MLLRSADGGTSVLSSVDRYCDWLVALVVVLPAKRLLDSDTQVVMLTMSALHALVAATLLSVQTNIQ